MLAGPDSAWSRVLEKPIPHPPPAVFGVVRTALFALTGIALWLVRRSNADGRRTALALFILQMGVDVAWTPALFARRRCSSELGVIVALWTLVAGTIAAFDRAGRRTAALLVPHLLWVAFAALNYRLWRPSGHE